MQYHPVIPTETSGVDMPRQPSQTSNQYKMPPTAETSSSTTYASSTPSTSIYNPLKTARSARLLAILPGKLDVIAQCWLIPVELEKSLPYEALSYCWGPPDPPVEIMFNGRLKQVTPNLGSALQYLKHDDLEV
jgi:hypothetical protein